MKYNRKEYVWNRNKEFYPIKVEELVKDINPDDFNTVIPILQKLNYPAFEDEWVRTKHACIRQEQDKKFMFKKYISKMWLMSYKDFTFEDSERINNLRKERLKEGLKNLII